MTTPGMQSDDRQRVLDATDIVRLVSECVALKPKGREYVGLCPFHDDRSPSMYVVPAKQIYHCFVCGAGGNALSFVMNFHKMEFREALEHLADRAGLTLTRLRPTAEGRSGPGRRELLDAAAMAASFYRAVLRHPEHGAAARAYVEKRGLSADVIESFAIGAAPDRWDGLIRTIQSRQLNTAAFVSAGLLKERQGGGHYDALRHRLVFPIQDSAGRVIAFGGRRLRDEDDPKYLNSPDTPLFRKSSVLFGLPQAAAAIRRAGTAVVAEGYMDVIACHQAGFANVVGTLGTALTPEHAGVLQRLCGTVVLLFDGDEAGRRAADRAVEVFLTHAVDVRIALLGSAEAGGAKDPDDLLRLPDGKARFERVIAGAIDALDYRFDRLGERVRGLGLSATARAVEEDLARLSELRLDKVSPVRRQRVVQRLAELAGVPEQTIREALKSAGPGAAGFRRSARGSGEQLSGAPWSPGGLLERAQGLVLGCLLVEPGLAGSLVGEERTLLDPEVYASPELRTLAETLARVRSSGVVASLEAVLSATEDPSVQRLATHLALTTQPPGASGAALHDLWRDSVRSALRERGGGVASTPKDASGSLDLLQAELDRLRKDLAMNGPDTRRVPKAGPGAIVNSGRSTLSGGVPRTEG